uniref:prenyl transferase n=1 Tax=Lithothamnion corallioides TaxID=1277934 RepID=UPI0023EFB741|nr:prenyl transferase [Lithothamnion corallioides]WEA77012.1 prenyl transferase [Lithothamnion corallioides]
MFPQIEIDLQRLDSNLKKMVGPRHPVLHAAAEHLFQAGGKRIRPAIIFLVAKATSNDKQLTNEHKRLAEITEIIHTASLLHDDVIDECNIRRGLGTVNSKFNNKVAVLAGDFLFAQASWYLANLNDLEVVKIISKVITDFAEGEVTQGLTSFDASTSIDNYINKSFYKTASLIASSCKASTILSCADIVTQNAFYNYGKHIGLAFQIIDDILDITGKSETLGKPAGSDLKNGNLTSPLLFALNESPALYELIEREFSEDSDIEYAIKLIKSTNGIKQATDLAIEHAQTAIESLKYYQSNTSIRDLKLLSNYIINRIS